MSAPLLAAWLRSLMVVGIGWLAACNRDTALPTPLADASAIAPFDLAPAPDLAPQCRVTTDCYPSPPIPQACMASSDCPPGIICAQNMCIVECTPHPTCPGAPLCWDSFLCYACNVDLGACVRTPGFECLSDADCNPAPTPRCDPRTNQCVACLPQSDNCPTGQYCSETTCLMGCKPAGGCDGGS